MAKQSFKEIHTNLTNYMEKRNEYPVVSFEDKENVPRQLRGKMFIFAAATGTDQKGKSQLGIMILEQKGTTQEPVCTLTGVNKAKDRRFRVNYQGKLLLLDDEVNMLLVQLGIRMKTHSLTEKIAGSPNGPQTTQ